MADAVERSKYLTAVAGLPAVSASPPPRQPVASKRYKPGYSRKVAAVIGINDYGIWPSLEGATPDAKRIAGSLRGMGFGVTEMYDGEATRERISPPRRARTPGTARSRAAARWSFCWRSPQGKSRSGRSFGGRSASRWTRLRLAVPGGDEWQRSAIRM